MADSAISSDVIDRLRDSMIAMGYLPAGSKATGEEFYNALDKAREDLFTISGISPSGDLAVDEKALLEKINLKKVETGTVFGVDTGVPKLEGMKAFAKGSETFMTVNVRDSLKENNFPDHLIEPNKIAGVIKFMENDEKLLADMTAVYKPREADREAKVSKALENEDTKGALQRVQDFVGAPQSNKWTPELRAGMGEFILGMQKDSGWKNPDGVYSKGFGQFLLKSKNLPGYESANLMGFVGDMNTLADTGVYQAPLVKLDVNKKKDPEADSKNSREAILGGFLARALDSDIFREWDSRLGGFLTKAIGFIANFVPGLGIKEALAKRESTSSSVTSDANAASDVPPPGPGLKPQEGLVMGPPLPPEMIPARPPVTAAAEPVRPQPGELKQEFKVQAAPQQTIKEEPKPEIAAKTELSDEQKKLLADRAAEIQQQVDKLVAKNQEMTERRKTEYLSSGAPQVAIGQADKDLESRILVTMPDRDGGHQTLDVTDEINDYFDTRGMNLSDDQMARRFPNMTEIANTYPQYHNARDAVRFVAREAGLNTIDTLDQKQTARPAAPFNDASGAAAAKGPEPRMDVSMSDAPEETEERTAESDMMSENRTTPVYDEEREDFKIQAKGLKEAIKDLEDVADDRRMDHFEDELDDLEDDIKETLSEDPHMAAMQWQDLQNRALRFDEIARQMNSAQGGAPSGQYMYAEVESGGDGGWNRGRGYSSTGRIIQSGTDYGAQRFRGSGFHVNFGNGNFQVDVGGRNGGGHLSVGRGGGLSILHDGDCVPYRRPFVQERRFQCVPDVGRSFFIGASGGGAAGGVNAAVEYLQSRNGHHGHRDGHHNRHENDHHESSHHGHRDDHRHKGQRVGFNVTEGAYELGAQTKVASADPGIKTELEKAFREHANEVTGAAPADPAMEMIRKAPVMGMTV